MKQLKNIFKFSAVVMLIAVMALTFISCSKEKEDNTTPGEITITVEGTRDKDYRYDLGGRSSRSRTC